ncbi:glycosyltransferase [Stenotrophomonas maltophilia]|nr:glycosyltransferase [Stenotrophomonas maltophilia]
MSHAEVGRTDTSSIPTTASPGGTMQGTHTPRDSVKNTIVHVVEATATGTLSMVRACANLLAEQGHFVHVVYSRRPETPSNLDSLFHPNVVLRCIPMGGGSIAPAVFHLHKYLRKVNPDIVHLHSSFAGFIGRAASIGLAARPRLFYSPHCISVMRRDINYKRYLFALLERIANLRSCMYLACSNSERSAIADWVGAKSFVVENAVESVYVGRRLSTAADQASANPLVVVSVGGVRRQKGPALMAEIARKCRESGLNFRFVWAGDGDPQLVSLLIDAGVEVTGWLGKNQVNDLLAHSDIYISTAQWEGLPVAVIEAMSSGLLVMATRCAGNVDAIDNGRTGILFDNASDALVVLQQIAEGQLQYSNICEAGLAEARSRFSLDRFSDRLIEAYNHPSPNTNGARNQ